MSFFSRAVDKMVNEKVPQKKRKRVIVLVSILTLLSMVTSTYAWFKVNTFSGVDSLDLHISVSAQLKVAMEDYGTDLDRYTKVITNEMINSYLARDNTNLEEIVLDPVTSNDCRIFRSQRGAERQPNKRSYLEFECFFIATEDMWVHLTTESTDDGMDDGTRVSTDSTGPKADVVNCTRVGFDAGDNGVATYEPNKGAQVTSLSTFDLPSGTMQYTNSTRLFHLNAMEPTKATIRLWIEGEDPQCDDDVQDAQLSVQLGFIGCDENNVPIS
ncbi:MAG: hypothetical protein Q4D44_07480 [Eubacteriales bacterium]|nr:hypothetical protein [Eubacteriales bacterium]